MFRHTVDRHPPTPGLPAAMLLLALAGLGRAADPAAGTAAPDPKLYGIEPAREHLEHWSFRPLAAPAVPPAAGGIQGPIDAFVAAGLERHGLRMSPPAEPRAWLRRVWYDLVGLPPAPEDFSAFLADSSPEARARVVDRLLADPGFGLRWGRRWLDVVRYADTNGYERDGNKPFAWRYRDYVIGAFNADKPFDRFLLEQLAGDELPDADAESMIAATFLRLGTWDDEPADPEVDRYDQLDDVVGTVSSVFLGLTLRCARCHNHKFEPISQIDYAGMLAFFEPLKRPQEGRKELDVPVGTRAERAEFFAATRRAETAARSLQEQIQALDEQVVARHAASGRSRLSEEAVAAHRAAASARTDRQKQLVKETLAQWEAELAQARTEQEARQRAAFERALALVREAAPAPLPRAYLWEEPAGSAPLTRVFRRGNPRMPAGQVAPGTPRVLAAAPFMPAAPPVDAASSWRRLSLARWMTAPENPLVARVAANRVWQALFGEGLVSTENDFGLMGAYPVYPALLDWLAATLRDSGWKLKPLIRAIVLSDVYGQSSAVNPTGERIDAANRLLWRYPLRRLDAEAFRDSLLFASGALNRQMHGPGVYPKIAREVLEGQSRPGDGWGAYDETAAARRSIYVFVKRSLLVPEMDVLDFADTTTSCEQRPVSTIATQALTLLNGEFVNQQAARLAARVAGAAGRDPVAQVTWSFRWALGRDPTSSERQEALQFLARAGGASEEAGTSALTALARVLFNSNEFSHVD